MRYKVEYPYNNSSLIRSVAKTTRGGSVEVDGGDETPGRSARGGSRGRETTSSGGR